MMCRKFCATNGDFETKNLKSNANVFISKRSTLWIEIQNFFQLSKSSYKIKSPTRIPYFSQVPSGNSTTNFDKRSQIIGVKSNFLPLFTHWILPASSKNKTSRSTYVDFIQMKICHGLGHTNNMPYLSGKKNRSIKPRCLLSSVVATSNLTGITPAAVCT